MAKKIINAPGDYVDEMLAGLVAAHSSIELVGESGRVVRRRGGIRAGKVGIVSGGGSGHLPLFTGYVGHGLLDSCSIGNVFEGPNAASCMEAIRAADGGAGVLLLYGNYGGDRMNFDMASEMPHRPWHGRRRQCEPGGSRQAPRRRRHRPRLQDRRRCRRSGGGPRRRRRRRRQGGGPHTFDRRGPQQLPHPGRGRPVLPAR